MKNVLYIGNALSNSGRTSTTIETLGADLRAFCSVKIASNKSNKIIRLFDMVKLVLANRTKTDYVIIDTYSTSNFYFALIISQLCKILNLKYILILHGGNLEKRLKDNPKLSHSIFNYAHKLVAPSLFLETMFIKNGFSNIIHIPNSIEINKYDFLNRNIDTIKMLWVRSFSSIYNPALAIEVFYKLKSEGINAKLTMVGPDMDGSLQKVKSLSTKNNLKINFTGKLSKSEWIMLSKDCNIFINTTNFDNTPVSVIEAMALGLPVVSTNVGGMPYLIEDGITGLLVPPNNSEAMIKAIEKLISNPALAATISLNARKQVEAFDWDIVKHQWLKLLK